MQRLVRQRLEELNARIQYKADCFDYLCWLEERQQKERVPGASMLVIASDGTTCWGHTYEEAVKVAMHHDKGLQDAAEAQRPNAAGERLPDYQPKP